MSDPLASMGQNRPRCVASEAPAHYSGTPFAAIPGVTSICRRCGRPVRIRRDGCIPIHRSGPL